MTLVPENGRQNSNFGKVIISSSTTLTPALLSEYFLSGASEILGIINKQNSTPNSTGAETLNSESDIIAKIEKIDITKSFLNPIGNISEGWILDTSDETFLLIPKNPRSILSLDSISDKKFQCIRLIRLGSKRISEILFKKINGIQSLYSLKTQEIRESKVGLRVNGDSKVILPGMDEPIDFSGPNGIYYREIFYEIPLHIATKMNSSGVFQSAQEWMHYVFNPQKEKAWIYRPFRELLENPAVRSRVTDSAALNVLQSDMLDPHAIADTRMVARMKAFTYIDNLLDWGDSLFAQDTRKAINESLILYLRCQAILGERPYSIPGQGQFNLKTRSANEIWIENEEDNFTKALFLPGWKNRPIISKYSLNSNETGDSLENLFILGKFRNETDDILENPSILGKFFEVPENKKLMTYWDRLDDRLDKIRRSLSLSGIFRQLPLFQPPIDPRALIAAGGPSNVLVIQPIPNYRYSFLLDNAKEMVNMTISFGAQLLTALETGSSEELAMQEVKMSLLINAVNKRIKNNAIEVASREVEQLYMTAEIMMEKLNRIKAKLDDNPDTEVAKKLKERYDKIQGIIDQNGDSSNLSMGLATAGSISSKFAAFTGNAQKQELDRREALKPKDTITITTQRTLLDGITETKTKTKPGNFGGRVSGFFAPEGTGEKTKAMKKTWKIKFRKEQKGADKTSNLNEASAKSTFAASVARALPETETGTAGLRPLVALKYGAQALSGALEIAGTSMQFIAAAEQTKLAKESATIEEALRILQLGIEEKDLSNDLEVIRSQVEAAQYNLDIAQAEYNLVEKEEELYNETRTFLRSKFTNMELYAWLSRQLRALLKEFYGLALDAAKMTERALQYELPIDE